MLHGETFDDWDSVRDSISRVKNDSRGSSGCVQRENSLHLNVESGHVKRLEEYLRRLFPVSQRVQRGVREQNWMLFRENLKNEF